MPFAPPGDQRIENARAQLGGHAGAVVLDLHARHQPMAHRADAHVGQRTRAQHDAAALARPPAARCAPTLSSAWMIWLRSSMRARQARIVVALDQHGRRRFGAQQVIHVLAQLVHVHRCPSPAAGSDPTIESTSAASRSASVMMTRGVFAAALALAQLPVQQLRGAAQAAERILDLVRELANHQAAAVQAREQVVVARDALRCVASASSSSRCVPVTWPSSGVTVRSSTRASRGEPIGRTVSSRSEMPCAGVERAAQDADEAVRVVQEIAERPAARLVQAERQQVLRGDVRVDGAELRIEHDDAGGQRIEQIRGIEVRERRGRLYSAAIGRHPCRQARGRRRLEAWGGWRDSAPASKAGARGR